MAHPLCLIHIGLTQGNPEAGFKFCVACHEEVKSLDGKLAVAGGKAIFGNDDGYAMGPPGHLAKTLVRNGHFEYQLVLRDHKFGTMQQ